MASNYRKEQDLIFQSIEEKAILIRQAKGDRAAAEIKFLYGREIKRLARACGMDVEELRSRFAREFAKRRLSED